MSAAGTSAGDEVTWIGEDVGRVLVVVAHPDDIEYGGAAAIARWTAAGREAVYVLATRGEAGIDTIPPEDCAPLREDEQRRSAAIVGVDTVEFLDHVDGILEAGLELRRDLTSAIRRHRPDTILTLNHREFWGAEGGNRNSADHRALGEALLDAVADAGNRWIFPELGHPPHHTGQVLVCGSPRARHAIDVTGFVDVAIESLAAHAAYLEALGDHPMADVEFLRFMLEGAGVELGVEAAVRVERFGD
ncbi:MAG: PIG-L family deacetylase [Nitriliruptoraceae bacterium]|nr:PIG-L family deacetylase [Nitriliruptoraceae bacterium]